MIDPDTQAFEGFFIVELMGRKKLVGYVREQTIAGAGFLRIEVPASEDQGPVTRFFRPETIYALTPTSEAIARAVAQRYRPEPIHAFELPREKPNLVPALSHRDDEDDLDDDEEDDNDHDDGEVVEF